MTQLPLMEETLHHIQLIQEILHHPGSSIKILLRELLSKKRVASTRGLPRNREPPRGAASEVRTTLHGIGTSSAPSHPEERGKTGRNEERNGRGEGGEKNGEKGGEFAFWGPKANSREFAFQVQKRTRELGLSDRARTAGMSLSAMSAPTVS